MQNGIRATGAVLGMMVALASAGMAQRTTAAQDRRFMMTAAQGGMAEVRLGKMAVNRGASQAVKEFGQHMVADHTRTNAELMQLARRERVTLPRTLDPAHRAAAQQLSRRSGEAFDRAFARQMVLDHRKMVNLFRTESRTGRDPQVRAWAAKTLPGLQEHLRMAQELQEQVR
jgi:putative membrane protein